MAAFLDADLSPDKPWGPSGGLRQRRGRCSEPRRPPPPRSPLEAGEEAGTAPQTRRYPPAEAGEAGRGCLLLGGNQERQDQNSSKPVYSDTLTTSRDVYQQWNIQEELLSLAINTFSFQFRIKLIYIFF